MAATPQWLDTLQKKSSLPCLAPHIVLLTPYLSLDFIFKNTSTASERSICRLFCLSAFWLRPLSIRQTRFTVPSHRHRCSTLSLGSFSADQRGCTTAPVSSTADLCQFAPTHTGQSSPLEISAAIYKGKNTVTAVLPGSMPPQNQ